MSSVPTTKPVSAYANIVGAQPTAPVAPQPVVPASKTLPELTPLPLITGIVLGMLFGASSLYLVMKVGLTVSASIPAAVISITFFRLISKLGIKNTNLLENNIVQTAASAGESIAFGLGVTMPALLLLGFDLDVVRLLLVALIGGLLGSLMIIPLRRTLIADQHGLLKYPEGFACAEILKAGASDDPGARPTMSVVSKRESAGSKVVFLGFGIAFLYQAIMSVLRGWREVPAKVFGAPLRSASVAAEISPALLGVGYIIGPRIASIMCAGGVMSYLVLIPLISYFAEGSASPVSPGNIPVGDMSPDDIRKGYILYIGAGAVTAAGIISLCRSLPMVWHGMRSAFSDLRRNGIRGAELARTERDLPMRFVVAGILILIILTLFAPQLQMNLIGACTILACGFLFVTVSARLTGEVGSSSNPVSGMATATLLITCVIFLVLGWVGPHYYVTALVIGAVVCIATSNAGTASQVLKTGFLLGATPWRQQIAIIIGTLCSAVILGPILLQLNNAGTVYVPRETYTRLSRNVGQLEPSLVSGLPRYNRDLPGEHSADFRELIYDPVKQKTIVAGLDVGVQYLVNEEGKVVYQVQHNFPKGLPPFVDTSHLQREEIQIPGRESGSSNYFVYLNKDRSEYFGYKYLVDEQGVPVYLVDPGINGTYHKRPDGVSVTKYEVPKATLFAYIIKGIFSRDLPWGLVLMGVMLALVLELAGIPSLVFAVGLYLPLSSSTPILFGGLVRWLVDRVMRRKYWSGNLPLDEIASQEEGSPGVLMASGYIAGAAIAGIIIAFVAGFMPEVSRRLDDWATTQNPFYNGTHADLLSLLPFLLVSLLLYVVGRELWLVGRPMLPASRKETHDNIE